jgi:hypothetical protein
MRNGKDARRYWDQSVGSKSVRNAAGPIDRIWSVKGLGTRKLGCSLEPNDYNGLTKRKGRIKDMQRRESKKNILGIQNR